MWRRTVWLCLVFRDHYFVRFFRALFTLKNFFKRMYVKNTKFRKIIRRVRAKLFKRRKWLFFKRWRKFCLRKKKLKKKRKRKKKVKLKIKYTNIINKKNVKKNILKRNKVAKKLKKKKKFFNKFKKQRFVNYKKYNKKKKKFKFKRKKKRYKLKKKKFIKKQVKKSRKLFYKFKRKKFWISFNAKYSFSRYVLFKRIWRHKKFLNKSCKNLNIITIKINIRKMFQFFWNFFFKHFCYYKQLFFVLKFPNFATFFVSRYFFIFFFIKTFICIKYTLFFSSKLFFYFIKQNYFLFLFFLIIF